MRRSIFLAMAVAGLVFATQANANGVEAGAELATGTVESNPNDFFACRALNTGSYSVHLRLRVQNQAGDTLADDDYWVEPWEGVELVFNVPSSPVANRTLVCKIDAIDGNTWGDGDLTWLSLDPGECVAECVCDSHCQDMCDVEYRRHLALSNVRGNATVDKAVGETKLTTDAVLSNDLWVGDSLPAPPAPAECLPPS